MDWGNCTVYLEQFEMAENVMKPKNGESIPLGHLLVRYYLVPNGDMEQVDHKHPMTYEVRATAPAKGDLFWYVDMYDTRRSHRIIEVMWNTNDELHVYLHRLENKDQSSYLSSKGWSLDSTGTHWRKYSSMCAYPTADAVKLQQFTDIIDSMGHLQIHARMIIDQELI